MQAKQHAERKSTGAPIIAPKDSKNGNVKAEQKDSPTSAVARWCHNEAIITPGELMPRMPWRYIDKQHPVRILVQIVGETVVLSKAPDAAPEQKQAKAKK